MDTYQSQFDALSDATRRAILARLVAGPMAVGQIASEFPMSRPAISQHLRILKDAKLVSDSPQGNRRLYSIDIDGLRALRQYFDQFWEAALAAFQARVNEKAHEEEV